MKQSRLRLLHLAAFALLSSLTLAQSTYPPNFSPHGPGGGGYMYSPAISPFDPNHIFLTCDMGGMYRSKNGGQTWTMQHTEDFVSTVKGKVQFSADPNILYAIRRSTTNLNDPLLRGELAKSTDGGATWQAISDPTETGVHCLEVDPGSTQRLLVNEYNQLFFSANGGNSWISVYHPSDDQMWLGGVFWEGQNIYVGTNHGLLVSKNGGTSFAIENHNGLPAATGIYNLAGAKSGTTTRLFCIPAPASDQYAWLEPLSYDGLRQGVFRMNYTTNAAWTNTRGNIPANVDIGWVDLAKNNTQIVWAEGTDPDGYTLTYKSVNGGQSWTSIYQTDGNQNISTGWTGADGAYWLQQNSVALGFDVSDNDPNYAIRTRGTVEVTNDGGNTWRSVYVLQSYLNPIGQPTSIQKFYKSSGLDVTTEHQIFWKNNQEIYLCNTDIGLTYSADAGDTWTFARNTFYDYGPVSNNNWYRMVERPDNHQLFAGVSELNDLYLDYRTSDAEVEGVGGLVVSSVDGGVTWDTLFNFEHPVVWIEIDKNNPARLWASVVHHTDGGIFSTSDGGQTWIKLNAPPRTEGHPYNIVSLKDGGLVVTYCARKLDDGNFTESSGVFFSPDGGNTWQDRTAPEMKFYTKDLIVDPHDPTENTWYSTVWGRSTPWPGPNNQENGGLYKTTNRGQSWTRIFAKTPSDQTESITIHPSKPETAYLTVENDGLYFTNNLNATTPTFERVTSYPWWRPKRVFFNPYEDSEVWVTSMGGGVWKGISSPAGVVNYTPSTEDFANPERGFYHYSESTDPLDAAEMASWRNPHQPFSATYEVRVALVFRYFTLEDFKNSPISNAYLNAMQQDFVAARQAGVKIIPRFAYTLVTDNGGCDYCPPYGDAPKSRVLEHIAQLKPILQANADVIATMQLGFIGIWGEGYYTDFFGDDSQSPFGLSPQNWNDRNEVLAALLDALPADRSVQVRYPQSKQKTVYGPSAPPSSAALTLGEAFQNTPKARIGHHNDCFLSSDSDVGTYENYDINGGTDTLQLKPYTASDTRFVPVGGETCADWNPYSNCNGQPGGGAQKEMGRMHWSYLNADYNNALNNDWVTGGCIEEIKQKLGYRLELQKGEFPTTGSPGQAISIKIELKNKGFAAPFNARKVRLLMRNVVTGALSDFDLAAEPRSWLPGNQIHSIEQTIILPANIPLGNYELLLHLADPYPALINRPEYAIRLANENTWEIATGYNRLLHQISVECAPVSVNITTLGDSTFCTGGSLTLYATQGFANYQWQYNGTPISGVVSDSLVVGQQGTYWVNAWDSPGCSGISNNLVVLEKSLPVPLFSYAANGLMASFSNNSTNATTYSWDFGDGSPYSTEVNPVHTFPGPGDYQVTLFALNNDCENSFTFQVTVVCTPPVVQLLNSSMIQVCEGESVTLKLADGNFTNYTWYVNGQEIPGAVSDSLVITVLGGIYKAYCTDALGCGNFSQEVSISIIPLPVAAINASAQAVCIDASITLLGNGGGIYQWILPNGSLVSGQVIGTLSASATDAGTYLLTVTNNGCSATATFTLVVNPLPTPVILPTGPILLAFGESVLLDAGAGYVAWLWNTGETSQQIVVTDCGEYAVTVVDNQACSASSSAVTVSISPVVTFDNGVLMSTPADVYQWFYSGIVLLGATDQSFVPMFSGEYSVEVNCSWTGWVSSNVVQVIISGVSETTIGKLKIYPNPVSALESELVLELQDLENSPFMLVLTDLAGREFWCKTEVEFSEKIILQTGNIPAGTYFVQVWQERKLVTTGLFLKI